jgi:diadenosine tetraphosphate (Ap4A) HIT family hydrolase
MTKEYCLFCDRENTKEHKIIAENEEFRARRDNFPVTQGHTEIVPKKHIESFFTLTNEEILQLFDLLKKVKNIIQDKYSPDAYNIGVNDGEKAGRSIHHLHIHIIPRYTGDVENPKGGVRNIIPDKGNY